MVPWSQLTKNTFSTSPLSKANVNTPAGLQPGAKKLPVGSFVGSGSTSSGQGFQRGFADKANMALGAASLVKGLLNRRPKEFKPSLYKANVRPAQGNEEAVQRAKNDITASAARTANDATKIAGSDVNAGLAARVSSQAAATKATSDVEFKNAELFRADQNRVSQELNQQELTNTGIKNEAGQYNNYIAQKRFGENQAASAAGVQSALQYEASREADLRNKGVAENNANQALEMMNSANWNTAYNNAVISGNKDKAREIADQAMKSRSLSGYATNLYSGRRGFFGFRNR